MHLVQKARSGSEDSESSEPAFEVEELRRDEAMHGIEPQLVRAVIQRHDIFCAERDFS